MTSRKLISKWWPIRSVLLYNDEKCSSCNVYWLSLNFFSMQQSDCSNWSIPHLPKVVQSQIQVAYWMLYWGSEQYWNTLCNSCPSKRHNLFLMTTMLFMLPLLCFKVCVICSSFCLYPVTLLEIKKHRYNPLNNLSPIVQIGSVYSHFAN